MDLNGFLEQKIEEIQQRLKAARRFLVVPKNFEFVDFPPEFLTKNFTPDELDIYRRVETFRQIKGMKPLVEAKSDAERWDAFGDRIEYYHFSDRISGCATVEEADKVDADFQNFIHLCNVLLAPKKTGLSARRKKVLPELSTSRRKR